MHHFSISSIILAALGLSVSAPLQRQIDLALLVLEAYVGPHENTDGFLSRFFKYHLMPFIQSLPPSAEVAELLPLIGTMDPEWIFEVFATDVPEQMLGWLKKIPSAPPDSIKLWEDYECMVFLEQTVQWRRPSFRFVQSFPDPTTELIAFWKQACKFDSKPLKIQDLEDAENKWRDVVTHWNCAIVNLDFPDELKLPYLF
ncbi:hypothetical protein B0H14DRAFT_3497681 [Mycena olivaceomarginata]|nr:hypothetical protein B0H14DRAFT_3497681 [Mycena olivaceomarginata]